MTRSVIHYLEQREKECEDILECVAGFGDLEKEVYLTLLEEDELTVDEVAEKVGKERSTVFRSLKNLLENDFAEKNTRGLDGGSYVNVYTVVPPEKVSKRMRDRVENWKGLVDNMIDEFEDQYS
jgi:predicted transcriptional regulator